MYTLQIIVYFAFRNLLENFNPTWRALSSVGDSVKIISASSFFLIRRQ